MLDQIEQLIENASLSDLDRLYHIINSKRIQTIDDQLTNGSIQPLSHYELELVIQNRTFAAATSYMRRNNISRNLAEKIVLCSMINHL